MQERVCKNEPDWYKLLVRHHYSFTTNFFCFNDIQLVYAYSIHIQLGSV